jgi:lysophospholipid acyltransferase (LPLAT)-like uncharacterized protein
MLKAFLRRPGVQAMIAAALALYLRFALGTTRWTVEGGEHLAPVLDGRPAVIGFWHETLPLMPALLVRARRRRPGLRVAVLASRHSDGRLLGEIMRRLGTEVAHGSSGRDGRERGGAAAVLALRGVLAAGGVAVLTPDGPRGPRRVAAPGIAHLAATAGVPVIPCGAHLRRHRRLGTWDRMILPRPFGRGALVCGSPVTVGAADRAAALAAIGAAMTAAAARAEALCA